MVFPIRFFPEKTAFSFMRYRKIGFALSGLLIIAALTLVFSRGLALGIDFTGGVLMDIRSEKAIDLSPLRKALSEGGFGEVSLQHLGDEKEIMVRVQADEADDQSELVSQIKEVIEGSVADADYRQIDFVGPSVGDELMRSGYLSLLVAFVAVLLYIWMRFEWQFGLGAVLALIHDAILTLGFYAFSGFDFGLTSIAAILTIIGYSINDSVVIYDRIRETMRRYKQRPLEDIIDDSINSTLSRTILTAGTTALAALALVIFGGEVIKGFSAALLFGITVGTYSSVFIAAPILIYLDARSIAFEEPAVNG
jgi:preprotein translocase SecF subunit